MLIKKRPTRLSADTIRVLQSAGLKRMPWLVHGFSTRSGGHSLVYGGRSLNLSFTKQDSRDAVEKNRRAFLLALGANNGDRPWPLIALKQIHSDIIHVIHPHHSGQLVGDGLITNVPGVALGVQTADCFPVLLVDSRNKAVGAFHAGWRGAGVPGNQITVLGHCTSCNTRKFFSHRAEKGITGRMMAGVGIGL